MSPTKRTSPKKEVAFPKDLDKRDGPWGRKSDENPGLGFERNHGVRRANSLLSDILEGMIRTQFNVFDRDDTQIQKEPGQYHHIMNQVCSYLDLVTDLYYLSFFGCFFLTNALLDAFKELKLDRTQSRYIYAFTWKLMWKALGKTVTLARLNRYKVVQEFSCWKAWTVHWEQFLLSTIQFHFNKRHLSITNHSADWIPQTILKNPFGLGRTQVAQTRASWQQIGSRWVK